MKLRTKLTLGTMALLAAALCICCSLTVFALWQSQKTAAADYTVSEADALRQQLALSTLNLNPEDLPTTRYALLRYYFTQVARSSSEGSEYVLQEGTDNIYNNSGINVRAVLPADYGGNDRLIQIDSAIVRLNGQDYCIAGYQEEQYGQLYTVAVVRDITQSMDKIREVILRCALIGGAVLLLTALCVVLLLNRALHPLRQLQQGAAAIAGGSYESRINLNRKDELGALGDSFDRMAEAVEQHVREVEATAEQQKLLLSALAHEMRTPVTAITGYAYALNHAKMTAEQQREAIAFVDSESRRLERLSSKLTQLISMENAPPALEQLSVSALLKTAGGILRPMAEESGVTLEMTVRGDDTVQGDADLLAVLLTNLFDNARKAGATRVTISFLDGVLSVADNGCGIPSSELEKITRPFYQVDASRNREGFGLGLALCRRIALLHGSDLLVESAEGRGSRFRICLYNSFTSP